MCIPRCGCTCKSNEYAKVRFAPDTTAVEQRWKWSTYIGNMLATTAASRRSNVGLDLQSKNSHKTRFWNSGVSQLVQYVWWFDQKGMLRQIRYGVVPQCPLFCINSGDVMRGGEGGGTEHETGNVLRRARLKLVDLYFSSWLTPHFSQLSFPHVKWSNITFQPPPFPYSAVDVLILWNTIF